MSRMTVVASVSAAFLGTVLCFWFQRGQPDGTNDKSRSEEWEEALNTFATELQASVQAPRTVIYPQVPDRISAMFGQNHPIQVSACVTSDQGSKTKETAVLYTDGLDVEIVGRLPDAINLSTDKEYVYVWSAGKKDGSRIRRDDHDLIAYVLYYLDPGWLVAGMYSAFLDDPNSASVTVSEEHNWKEIRFVDRSDGYEAIYVAESPVWFCGWRGKNDTNVLETTIISEPTSIAGIPETIRKRRQEITFTDTETALKDLMVFP